MVRLWSICFWFQGDLVAVGVLSGNRNFEGRIHPLTRANYLASPPLVIAYAIAGTVLIDFEKEPLGKAIFPHLCACVPFGRKQKNKRNIISYSLGYNQ